MKGSWRARHDRRNLPQDRRNVDIRRE